MVDVDHIASAAIPLAAVTLHLPSYPRARASAVDLFEFLQLGKALEIKLHLSCLATKAFQLIHISSPVEDVEEAPSGSSSLSGCPLSSVL